jgi:GNAT superfamily N-acetyltransferase
VNQHARKPRPALKLLVRERRDLVCALEPFHKIAHELAPLFERHWHELALDRDRIALDPDWDRYYDLATVGTLKVTTARCDGVLVGYIFNLIGPHLHYRSTLHVEIEMFWLDPAYRGGWFALRWFRDNEAAMKKLGASRISAGLKNHFMGGRVGLIFRRMGYSPVETIYSKVI